MDFEIQYVDQLPKEIWLEIVKFIIDGSTWKSFIITCRYIYKITQHLHISYKNKFISLSGLEIRHGSVKFDMFNIP